MKHKQPNNTKPLIFLCHAKEDIDHARSCYDHLKEAGFDPWLDEKNILPGQNWNLEIQKAMDQADFALILLSKGSIKKRGFLNKEILWALDKQKEMLEDDIFVIPIKLDGCQLPRSLSSFQAVDLFGSNGMERLIETLNHQFYDVTHKSQTIHHQKRAQNPYMNRGMLMHDSPMFFGRINEINTIRDLISKTKSVSIIGERRIGKSSLMFRMYHEWLSSKDTIAIYMDCNELEKTCRIKDDFFQAMNEKLKDAPDNNQFQCVDNYFVNYRSFKRFIEKQSKQGMKFIVFLDEFERLPKMSFADDSFFSNLRSIANNPENHFAYVTVSKKKLSDLAHTAIDSSNFWNIFHPQPLGMLDKHSIDELRAYGFYHPEMALTETDLSTIDYYAGHFPFFNQIVCCYLYNAKMDKTPLNEAMMISDLKEHYEVIWELRTLQEQKILKNLRHQDINKTKFKMIDMIVRGLVEMRDGVYVAFSEFFDELVQGEFKVRGKAFNA